LEQPSNPRGRAGKLQTQDTNTRHKQEDGATAAKHPRTHAGNYRRLVYTNHLPMASAARQRSNMAIGVTYTRIEALVPCVHAITTAVGRVVSLHTQCV